MIDVIGTENSDDAGDMAVMTAMGTASATATFDGDGGPTKKPKSVTFSSSCKTKLVPHYKDYTKRQWNQIWYTQEEIDTMNILSEKERRAEKKKQQKASAIATAAEKKERHREPRQSRNSIMTRSPKPKGTAEQASKRSSSLIKRLLGMNPPPSPSKSPASKQRMSFFKASPSPKGGRRRTSVQSSKGGGLPKVPLSPGSGGKEKGSKGNDSVGRLSISLSPKNRKNRLPPSASASGHSGRRHSTATSSEGLPPKMPQLTSLDRYTSS